MAWCSARGQREQGAGPSISTRRWHRGRRCWHKSGPVQEISRMDDRQELVICYSHRARRCRKCGWVSSGLIPAQECRVAPGGMSLPCTPRSMDGAAEQVCAHPSILHRPGGFTPLSGGVSASCHLHILGELSPKGSRGGFPSLGQQLKGIRGSLTSPSAISALLSLPARVFQLCLGNVGTLLSEMRQELDCSIGLGSSLVCNSLILRLWAQFLWLFSRPPQQFLVPL